MLFLVYEVWGKLQKINLNLSYNQFPDSCQLNLFSGENVDVPDLVSDSGSEPDCEDEVEWEELDDDYNDEEFHPLQGTVNCLFSMEKFSSVEELLLHCKTHYNFDLVKDCQASGIDCISYIKMINFIRRKVRQFISTFFL